MASLPSPTVSTLKHNPKPNFSSSLRPAINNLCFFSSTNRLKNNHSTTTKSRCNAFYEHLEDALHLDQVPLFRSGYLQFERITEDLSETQKWGFLVFAGLTWIYLTARPGVLVGAIDAYLLAPLQLGFDSLIGRRSLKMTGFVVGDKLGEGSFGIVYAGAIVPKNVTVEEKRGKAKTRKLDSRFKDKVILKMVTFNVIIFFFLCNSFLV